MNVTTIINLVRVTEVMGIDLEEDHFDPDPIFKDLTDTLDHMVIIKEGLRLFAAVQMDLDGRVLVEV